MSGVPLKYVLPWPEEWLGPLPDTALLDRLLVGSIEVGATDYGLRASCSLYVIGGINLLSVGNVIGILIGANTDGVAVEVTLGDGTNGAAFRLALSRIGVTLFVDAAVLRPVLDGTDEPDLDATRLLIPVGQVGFAIDSSGQFLLTGGPTLALPRCMIGQTDIIVEANDIFPRLSGEQELPPAAAALSLPDEWRGVFVGMARLTMPKALAGILPNDLTLRDCAIGNLGFTGSIDLDWTPPLAAQLFGVVLALDHIGIDIRDNELTQLDLRGSLTLPALKKENGDPAPIGFVLEAGNAGYRLVAGDIPPIKLGGIELDLERLGVGFDAAELTEVDIRGVLRIPGLEDENGADADIAFDIGFDQGVYELQASEFPPLELGPFAVRLDELDVSFDQSGLRSSEIAATVIIPGMESADGGPAEIGVRIGAGSDDFSLTVQNVPPLRLAALEVELETFSLQFGKSTALAAEIAGKLKIPNVEDAAGDPVQIGFDLEIEPNLLRIAATEVPTFQIAGNTVELDTFSIAFDDRGIVASETAISGVVRIPAFKNSAGDPLDIAVTVDLSDGFAVTAEVPGSDLEVLAIADTIRIALSKLSFGVGAQGVRFSVGGRIDNGLSIPVIGDLLPSSIVVNELALRSPRDVDLDVELAWASGISVGSDGDGGFEVDVPIGEIGAGLSVDSLHLAFRDAGAAYEFAVAFRGASLELGPVIGLVDGIGIQATVVPMPDGGGNVGPLDIELGFIPPTGIGLSLDAGSVKLAGFLGIEEDGYVGAAELTIQDSFGLSMVGLLTTRMPDGSEGLSLLAIVAVELPTPIHIAYGIFFAGAGGLLGLNRSVDIDRLGAGLRTGAADSILFPKDVLRNINTIITDLREVFPPTPNQFVIGPMVLLTWSTPPLIKAKVGIIIEFPNPVSISLLGTIRAALPTEKEAIIDLKIAFLGAIEFDKCLIRFDAALYDSYIGSGDWKFAIEGDFSFRISYGERKDFVTSVGGFHPLYQPPEYLRLPSPMRRVRLSLLKDNPRLTLAKYFAITSNTVQFGADLDFQFDVKVFSIVGDFGFDVLFQSDPCRFIANVWATLAVKAAGMDVLTLKLDFELQGTTPWIATGTASFKVLFWEGHAEFEKTFGPRKRLDPAQVEVLPIVLKEFERVDNWLGELHVGGEKLVEMRELAKQEGEIVLDGSSVLRIAQAAVPLDMDLERFGAAEPSDARRVVISAFRLGGADQAYEPAPSDFAPAAYRAMSDREKLAAASFEPRTGGVRMREATVLDAGTPLGRPVLYETFVSDLAPAVTESGLPGAALGERLGKAPADPAERFARWAAGGSVAKSPAAVAARRRTEMRSAVTLDAGRFAVVQGADLTLGEGATDLTRSEAEELRKRLGSGDYVVVPAYKRRAG